MKTLNLNVVVRREYNDILLAEIVLHMQHETYTRKITCSKKDLSFTNIQTLCNIYFKIIDQ